MIRGVMSLVFVLAISLTFVGASACELDITMLNQEPYPAVPGDYVELVFQVAGIENPECGTVVFSLVEKYPLIFDPEMESSVAIASGTFTKDFSASKVIPYRVRVDDDALNGDNPIEVSFFSRGLTGDSYQTKSFNLNVEDARADFEIFVKDYDFSTNMITFEILNIADVDVEALTLDIPIQDGVVVKGAKRSILGDLDSNEYTSADFELTASADEIVIDIFYTDSIGVRRNTAKVISYESDYFVDRKADVGGTSKMAYIFWIVVFLVVGYFVRKRFKKKKQHHKI